MDARTRLKQQFAFSTEIDKEKFIERQTYLSDAKRKENDAEHAWHAAIMAYLLREYSNKEIDVLKVVMMLLTHDLVEIDAGDTYAYDEEGKKTKEAREQKAAERIYGLLPEDQQRELRALWDEFEAGETQEAKFAHTMDNIQPLMLNVAAEGRSWREHEVHLNQILKRNAHTAEGAEELWEYAFHEFIKPNLKNGNIKE